MNDTCARFLAPARPGLWSEVDDLSPLPCGYDERSLKVERGFHAACEDLAPQRKLVVYPGLEPFPLGNAVQAMPLAALCAELKQA